jgi:hypothetical protein
MKATRCVIPTLQRAEVQHRVRNGSVVRHSEACHIGYFIHCKDSASIPHPMCDAVSLKFPGSFCCLFFRERLISHVQTTRISA